MRIATVSNNLHNRDNTQRINSISQKGGLDSLNKINPIARKADDYFVRMAKVSTSKFEPIIEQLQDKIKPITIKNKKINLTAWDINPMGADKYILFLHGMAQNISNYQKLYSAILENQNYGILALEYQGYGENKKGKVSEDALISDVKSGLKFLKQEKNISPNNIIVMGHSMGGALGINIASKEPSIKALILLSPLSNMNYLSQKFSENSHIGLGVSPFIIKLTEKIKPLKWLYAAKFNSINRIKKVKSPVYLIHSTNDIVTTSQGAKKLEQVALDNNILIKTIFNNNGGHKVDFRKISICLDILKNIDQQNI